MTDDIWSKIRPVDPLMTVTILVGRNSTVYTFISQSFLVLCHCNDSWDFYGSGPPYQLPAPQLSASLGRSWAL